MSMEKEQPAAAKVKDEVYYKNKYKILRRTAIEIMHHNAAICSEITRTEEKANTIKLERKYLMKKLMQYEKPKIGSLKSGSKLKGENAKGRNRLPKGRKGQSSKGDSSERNGTSTKPNVIRVKPINVDQNGRPIFPIEIGPLSIYSIGEIVNSYSQYHDSKCIFPVGYCSTRLCSILSSEQQCLYTCKILDDGHNPRFEISPEDSPETIFSSHIITDAYSRFQNSLGPETNDLSGMGAYEFFGLSQPTVQNLIQSLPGACRCTGYEWKKIEVIQPRNGDSKSKPKSKVRQSDINIEALEKWARDA